MCIYVLRSIPRIIFWHDQGIIGSPLLGAPKGTLSHTGRGVDVPTNLAVFGAERWPPIYSRETI